MKYILYILLLFVPVMAGAQNNSACRRHISDGNREFHANNQDSPSKAELLYRKALAANPSNAQAMYNLGVALLAQNKDSAAYSIFVKAAQVENNKQRKAMSFHNMGVIMQKQQQFGQAIEAYKQALRFTPHDNKTRYNMVLCMRLNKNNNQNNNNQNNKNNKNKDKNKNDNKDKNKKDQNKNQQDKNQQDKQKPQPQPQQMSKENAEQLLQAAMQNEKTTQQRLKKAMSQPRRRNLQKNW